ncbi:hypothetical protein HHL19_36130 [Streptomyces sp. R302]|nr:hypothetical protein [Streptomyces sp. R301]NML83940.1 hypothetical protein [Streptomyces sp. R302]
MIATGVLAGTALAAPGLTSAAPGAPGVRPSFCAHDQRPTPQEYLCAQPGDVVEVRIGDVHPTQPSLGYDQVSYNLGRDTLGKDAINKKFDDWCEANVQLGASVAGPDARLDDPTSFTCEPPVGQETAESTEAMKTVVIGPGGVLYLTDGHHTLTSLYELPDAGPRPAGAAARRGQPQQAAPADVPGADESREWVWLRDVGGNPVDVPKLPKRGGRTGPLRRRPLPQPSLLRPRHRLHPGNHPLPGVLLGRLGSRRAPRGPQRLEPRGPGRIPRCRREADQGPDGPARRHRPRRPPDRERARQAGRVERGQDSGRGRVRRALQAVHRCPARQACPRARVRGANARMNDN